MRLLTTACSCALSFLRFPCKGFIRYANDVNEARWGRAKPPRRPRNSFFAQSVLASGLSAPTAMEWSPDGRLFVCQQGGALRIIKNGQLLAQPALNLQSVVNSAGERGLLGVTFAPDFAQNQWIYVYYTVGASPIHNRVSRFALSGDVANVASEAVLLDIDPLSDATNHNGGAIHFGPDGKLYIAVGENANPVNAQTLTNRSGKLLRINRDGSIPADNPFFSAATGPNRAIWALGLRNPYTFAFQPGGKRLFINDVGKNAWEEINDGYAGVNYGWPNSEGLGATNGARNPLLAYPHGGGSDQGFAVTGGAFYNPAQPNFPAQYVGGYFYADFANNWVRFMDVRGGNASSPFATDMGNPVDLKVGPDGAVYALSRASNSVIRIAHAADYHYSATDLDTSVQDNQTRLLLQSKSGDAALYRVNDAAPGTILNTLDVAPVAGYLPVGVAVTSDGATRLLRASADGIARVDVYDAGLAPQTAVTIAPVGFTPTAISGAPTGSDWRLLWTNYR